MMRAAVFVDAGYLFAQGSALLAGSRQPRECLAIDIPNLVAALKEAARASCSLPLLRIYWYDAMRLGRPTPEQSALADANDIKLRLGQINSAGQQKGVDALIITDLAQLARNHAITDAVLLSGDEDVRVGVVLAQEFGVRVHLLGIQPARANQSRALAQEADTTAEWDDVTIRTFLSYSPPVSPSSAATAAPAADLDAQIATLVATISPEALAALKAGFLSSNQVPADHDKALLRIGRGHYHQTTLTEAERNALRATFKRMILAT
jgi:uncharacterized LabA/DUF88 family protein